MPGPVLLCADGGKRSRRASDARRQPSAPTPAHAGAGASPPANLALTIFLDQSDRKAVLLVSYGDWPWDDNINDYSGGLMFIDEPAITALRKYFKLI
jgi:hypothetical protein